MILPMQLEPVTKAPNQSPPFTTLTLKGLRCEAKVGWTELERSIPQSVDIDVSIRFSELPPACYSDELTHTICYADLTKLIKERLSEQSFKLIERMAYKIHQAIQVRLTSKSLCWVRVTKLKPPVPDLHGNTSFSYGDFVPEGE
jgi:7,8-dihydroneopterin aldolase/epimerase/oxygenase